MWPAHHRPAALGHLKSPPGSCGTCPGSILSDQVGRACSLPVIRSGVGEKSLDSHNVCRTVWVRGGGGSKERVFAGPLLVATVIGTVGGGLGNQLNSAGIRCLHNTISLVSHGLHSRSSGGRGKGGYVRGGQRMELPSMSEARLRPARHGDSRGW